LTRITIDRKFDFSFAAELCPELIVRFRETPAGIKDRVENLSAAEHDDFHLARIPELIRKFNSA
jgi:hypothetical protein